MKNLFLFILVLSFFGCKKVDPNEQFQSQLMGTWMITHARLSPSDQWIDISAANDQIVITETTMLPWKPSYTIVDENTFNIPSGSSSNSNVDVFFF